MSNLIESRDGIEGSKGRLTLLVPFHGGHDGRWYVLLSKGKYHLGLHIARRSLHRQKMKIQKAIKESLEPSKSILTLVSSSIFRTT